MITKIKQYAAKQLESMIKHRRHLHMYPSMSFHEEETVAYIKEQLTSLNVQYRDCGENGIVATMSNNTEGPCIAFRADIDALGIQEVKPLEYASKIPGVMHACGHDAHVATLLGMAHLLSENPSYIKGSVVLIFQYAEELPPGGAAPMIKDGCLEGVDKIFGFHVSDELSAGVVGIRSGAYMAASDSFFIELKGEGGHGSRPSDTVDTVAAMGAAIQNINSIISRFISPIKSAVISICNIHGGHSYNVIPSKVIMEGTVRTYEKETSELIEERIELAVKTACEMYGVKYSYRFERGYPVLANHETETQTVADVANKLGLQLEAVEKTPVSEDFGYYLQNVPGSFFRVGINNPDKDCIYPLHNHNFDLDEDQLKVALECFFGVYLAETGQL